MRLPDCYGFNAYSLNMQAVPHIKLFAERIFVNAQQLFGEVVEK